LNLFVTETCLRRVTELAGKAPALIITAEFDPLCDAAKLRAAHVPISHYCGQR
jgi:acetyl esterase/lipase